MTRIHDEHEPGDARQELKRIANQFPEEIPDSSDALGYYRGMRSALDEAEFRWGSLIDGILKEPRGSRHKRLVQYRRYLELFEIEIQNARKLRLSEMAIDENWSGMDREFADGIQLWRYRLSLRLAAFLFRFGIPGAVDVCDSAAFQIFRLVYLVGSPAA